MKDYPNNMAIQFNSVFNYVLIEQTVTKSTSNSARKKQTITNNKYVVICNWLNAY